RRVSEPRTGPATVGEARPSGSPSPQGRGRGEGERDVQTTQGARFSSPFMAAELRSITFSVFAAAHRKLGAIDQQVASRLSFVSVPELGPAATRPFQTPDSPPLATCPPQARARFPSHRNFRRHR